MNASQMIASNLTIPLDSKLSAATVRDLIEASKLMETFDNLMSKFREIDSDSTLEVSCLEEVTFYYKSQTCTARTRKTTEGFLCIKDFLFWLNVQISNLYVENAQHYR